MALIGAGKMYKTEMSIPVSNQLNNFFYYTDDYNKKYVCSNVSRTLINSYYQRGVDINYLFRNVSTGSVVKIFTLADGRYFGVYIKSSGSTSDTRFNFFMDFVTLSFRFYNKDGTYTVLNDSSSRHYYKIRLTSGTIYYPSIFTQFVYDENAKQGALSFVSMWDYDNGTLYYDDTRGYIYQRHPMVNWNLTKQYQEMGTSARELDNDPWSEGGYSGIGGGNGTFEFTGDTVGLPSLPSVDAVSTGFLQLFSDGLGKIVQLSKYMWSSNFFDNIVKISSNPLDIIMGLYMYPFLVPVSGQKYVRAGNVITDVSMGVPQKQIIEIDCGNLTVPSFYGAYLDYEPFTKCEIFLPYCGTFPLSMDDISGKTINVKYRVDLLTGVCASYVIIDNTVKYNFTGTCAINIPISSRSFENVYSSIMSVVGSMHSGSSFGLPSVGSVAGAVTSGKNQIQHGGNCSGNAGFLGVQKPYLFFSIPRVAIPKGQNKYTGYPIFATYKLGDLKGYTEIEEIHLENMGQATQSEIDKILSLLVKGVIL